MHHFINHTPLQAVKKPPKTRAPKNPIPLNHPQISQFCMFGNSKTKEKEKLVSKTLPNSYAQTTDFVLIPYPTNIEVVRVHYCSPKYDVG